MSFEELAQATGLSQDELLLEVAVMLFEKGKLTLAQAARLAHSDRLRFQHLLASRQIPVHYEVRDLEEDLDNLRSPGQA